MTVIVFWYIFLSVGAFTPLRLGTAFYRYEYFFIIIESSLNLQITNNSLFIQYFLFPPIHCLLISVCQEVRNIPCHGAQLGFPPQCSGIWCPWWQPLSPPVAEAEWGRTPRPGWPLSSDFAGGGWPRCRKCKCYWRWMTRSCTLTSDRSTSGSQGYFSFKVV